MGINDLSERKVQAEALTRAQEAANIGNGLGMIQGIFDSLLLEAYQITFKRKYAEIDHEDIRDIIGTSTDELYDRISRGEKIRKVETYLWKIVDRSLTEFDKNRKLFNSLDGVRFDIKDPGSVSEAIIEERTRQREKVISTAESLIPQLGHTNAQEVMKYLFGAIRNGVQDITSNEIGDAIGLTPGNVRVSMKRGLERLTRIFKEKKLVDEYCEFLFLEEVEGFLEIEADEVDGPDD